MKFKKVLGCDGWLFNYASFTTEIASSNVDLEHNILLSINGILVNASYHVVKGISYLGYRERNHKSQRNS
ncbi:hypothetical protein PNA2_0987 [Pyrococcus sp. NA2]|nr:hypothetical protein PNA2_0987 [Pyrococcus sp. NA2]